MNYVQLVLIKIKLMLFISIIILIGGIGGCERDSLESSH